MNCALVEFDPNFAEYKRIYEIRVYFLKWGKREKYSCIKEEDIIIFVITEETCKFAQHFHEKWNDIHVVCVSKSVANM